MVLYMIETPARKPLGRLEKIKAKTLRGAKTAASRRAIYLGTRIYLGHKNDDGDFVPMWLKRPNKKWEFLKSFWDYFDGEL